MKDMFKQGPMTQHEAEELARRYRAEGREPIITNGFSALEDGSKPEFYVFVALKKSNHAPQSSRTYQNPMWH